MLKVLEILTCLWLVYDFSLTRHEFGRQCNSAKKEGAYIAGLVFFGCDGAIAWSLERVFYSQFICVMSLSASAGNLDRVHLMHDDCKLFVSCETFPSLDSSRTSRTQGKRKQHRYKGKIGAKLKNGPGYTHVRESGSKSILRVFFCKVKK